MDIGAASLFGVKIIIAAVVTDGGTGKSFPSQPHKPIF
jgi:hypothetical protein